MSTDQQDELGSVVAKPLLRGWLHMVVAPLCVVGCLTLLLRAPTTAGKVGAAVFGLSGTQLFATSALYHRRSWGPRADILLRRVDHSNIFVIIAGTYTPFALVLLEGGQRLSLLLIVWLGALAGVVFRVVWIHAPRWLYTPIYVALGWVAIFYFEPLRHHGGDVVVALIVVGGVLYTVGALVYGLKRPNPWPAIFGFHEIFHLCTVAAFIAHFVGVWIAIMSV